MAELNKVVAALLRDISAARNVSDFYSKEMAKVYSEDSLLKFFPVPRVDIKELNLDLKFAIGTIEVDPHRNLIKDSKLNSLHDKYAGLLVAKMYDVLKNISTSDSLYKDALDDIGTTTKSESLKREFSKELENYFQNPASSRISSQTLSDHFNVEFFNQIETPYRYKGFDILRSPTDKNAFTLRLNNDRGEKVMSTSQNFKSKEEVYDVINVLTQKSKTHVDEKSNGDQTIIEVKDDEGKTILKDAFIKFNPTESQKKLHGILKDDSATTSMVKVFTASVQTAQSILKDKFPVDNPVHLALNDSLRDIIKDIEKERDSIEQTESELKVNIKMTADELKGIPENSISTIRITTSMQNYSVANDPETNINTLIPQ